MKYADKKLSMNLYILGKLFWPEVYQFAKCILDDHNTLDPWDWSLTSSMVATFVFKDKFIHGSDGRFGNKMH
jgi:hypothetical protein